MNWLRYYYYYFKSLVKNYVNFFFSLSTILTGKALSKNRIKALSYHAGLSDGDRSDAQMKWINGTVQVCCFILKL